MTDVVVARLAVRRGDTLVLDGVSFTAPSGLITVIVEAQAPARRVWCARSPGSIVPSVAPSASETRT